MAGKFTIFTGKSGKTYFNLKAGNGEIILASQGYVDKSGARNGVESVRTNAAHTERFEKKVSGNGKFHFNLKAGNGQVIGNSEMYESEKARDAGIASVASNAPGAALVEE
ncbi:MAG TPA: YegP family protein [Tahibacter sp.]|nr:YegP family protein [Tahibacter sp.]